MEDFPEVRQPEMRQPRSVKRGDRTKRMETSEDRRSEQLGELHLQKLKMSIPMHTQAGEIEDIALRTCCC
jgi:hypothetical protein